MNKIIEIMPDDMPEWAQKAMDEGRLFSTCIERCEKLEREKLNNNPQHESVDAFWKEWERVGEADKHGVYESTWMAFNKAAEAMETQIIKESERWR